MPILIAAPLAGQGTGQGDSLAAAVAAIQAGHYDAAIADAEQGIHRTPSDPRLYTVEAVAFSLKGDDPSALRYFRHALRLHPALPQALRGEAQILFRQHDPQAAAILHQILQAAPGDETAREMLAETEASADNCPAAVTDFEQAQAAVAQHPASLLAYGACLFQVANYAAAVPVFAQLLALHPDDADARYDLGLVQSRAGQNEAAISTLTPLLGSAPDVATLTLAADTYESLGNTPQAVALLRQAIVLDPAQPDTYVRFAETCMQHESYEAGVQMLNAGISRLPKDASLYLARGMLYAGMAQYAKSESDFRSAASLDPAHGTGSYGVGLVEAQSNHSAEALATVRKGLASNPNDARLHFLLARLLIEGGASAGSAGFIEAERSVQKAVALDPSIVAAHDLLADIDAQTGDTAGAIDQSQAALRIAPDDQAAMYHLLLASRKGGDTAAVQQMSKRLATLHQKARDEQTTRLHYRIVQSGSDAPSPDAPSQSAPHP